VSVVLPVPPLATGKVPVTSDVRFIRAVDMAPAVALRNPESEPIESVFVVTPLVKVLVPEYVLLVVVPKAVDMLGAVPPEDRMG
jgi:hypothetical protein